MILGASLLAGTLRAETINFDDAKVAEAPVGWIATKTGNGTAKWAVARDDSAPSGTNVLKQSGEATYPLCLKTDTKLKDGFVEVKFKPVSGREDQAGGVVWRAKDADNYFIARANALEDNITIYHTIKGRRVAFKNTDTKVVPGVWHTLRVDFVGDKFTVTFDGKKVIEATDGTITDAGMVGVWTKADSVTVFDDFSYSDSRHENAPRSVALLSLCGSLTAASLTLEKTIALPTVEGRIDHFAHDVAGGRLFIAALGNDTVEVVDLQEGKVIHSISGLSEPQGIFFLGELNRLYVANGGDGALHVFDGSTFAPVATVKFAGDADNVRYDGSTKRSTSATAAEHLARSTSQRMKLSLTSRSRDIPNRSSWKRPARECSSMCRALSTSPSLTGRQSGHRHVVARIRCRQFSDDAR